MISRSARVAAPRGRRPARRGCSRGALLRARGRTIRSLLLEFCLLGRDRRDLRRASLHRTGPAVRRLRGHGHLVLGSHDCLLQVISFSMCWILTPGCARKTQFDGGTPSRLASATRSVARVGDRCRCSRRCRASVPGVSRAASWASRSSRRCWGPCGGESGCACRSRSPRPRIGDRHRDRRCLG